MNSSPEDEAWILEIASEDEFLGTLLDEKAWRTWMTDL
jgi:glycine cleavage system H lipoate-binding protein